MLVRVGILAGGLAALAFFAGWPMLQVLQGEETITIYFKGIIAAAMLTAAGLNVTLLGSRGIPWTKSENEPLTAMQKVLVAATVLSGFLIIAIVCLFFHQYGYSIF